MPEVVVELPMVAHLVVLVVQVVVALEAHR
jgi:hypothetical protein